MVEGHRPYCYVHCLTSVRLAANFDITVKANGCCLKDVCHCSSSGTDERRRVKAIRQRVSDTLERRSRPWGQRRSGP
jgi:hypothetical protein